ncbi:MAG: MFS transporter [Clostridia bacterium]|nr:MFS transporter [Clostridia bacterium]
MAEETRILTPEEEAVQKQREHQNKNYLSPKDYIAYNLSGFGDKNWDTFNSRNASFFNRNILGVSAWTLSKASVVSSIADTLDNAISGPIIDRTRTRWGRVRPFLVLTLPLWCIAQGMNWSLPTNLSQSVYLVIFSILYYLGSIANSFYAPAYGALLYNLTPNIDERNRLIATDTYADLIGGSVLPEIFKLLVDILPKTLARRTIYMGGAYAGVLMVIIFRIYGFFALRERVPLASREQMNEVSVWKSFKSVAGCRPMWVVLIKGFFGVGKGMSSQIESDFWINCYGKLSYSTIAGIFTGLPSYFVLPFAPKLTRKMGVRNLCCASYAFCGLSYFIMYLVGFQPFGKSRKVLNIIWITIALTVCGSLNSIQRYSSTAMTGDLYDYVEWKTGIRNEGMINAAMGYVSLLTNQASTLISGALITKLGIRTSYVNGNFVPSDDPVLLRNIWIVLALCPAIGRFMKGVTLMFFNVNGKTKERMMEELAVARAAKVMDKSDKETEQ